MMKSLLTVAIVSIASLAFVSATQAQVVVPPGQDFYATPVSKGDIAMPQARIVTEPAAKKPGGKKHRVMRRRAKRS